MALRFSKNLLCPSLRTGHQFYLISPEAYLLTFVLHQKYCNNKKKRKGLPRCAAGSLALCGGSDQLGLIFWLLLYQDKSNSHRGK
jgi:hypothetical protein